MMAEGVGILAIELYAPKLAISQEALEQADNIPTGKNTIGLGQQEMSFCDDQEDTVSISLTVTKKLFESYGVLPSDIGYVSVGTETLIDVSKSVTTELMMLFGENANVEGVDMKCACFGGTQALFCGVDWVRANWARKKKYALIVMADIAIYEEGAARYTGGAGAVAVLVGPDAPIVFDDCLRGTFQRSAWDFYKPLGGGRITEYPVVNGGESLRTYMLALDECYKDYKRQAREYFNEEISIDSFGAAFFHSPFTKMVQKAIGRLHYWDIAAGKAVGTEDLRALPAKPNLDDRAVITQLLRSSANEYERLTLPYLDFNRRCGNMNTAALFAQLVAWLAKSSPKLSSEERRILFYSYGSGCSAAMFSVRVTENELPTSPLSKLRRVCQRALEQLDQRVVVSPAMYRQAIAHREDLLTKPGAYTPSGIANNSQNLFPGTYFLSQIDKPGVRSYDRMPIEMLNGHHLNGHFN
ncbi:unnamed protein product, partial [Mesorhabditis spiculigera]